MKVLFQLIVNDGEYEVSYCLDLPAIPRPGDLINLPGFNAALLGLCIWDKRDGQWIPCVQIEDETSPDDIPALLSHGWTDDTK